MNSKKLNLKHLIYAFMLMVTAGLALAYAAPVATEAQSAGEEAARAGINEAGGDGSADAAESSIQRILETIVDILSVVVGAIAVIMIIIGGFRLVTSAGDSQAVASARNTIIYALVGIAIVIFAQTIVKFVIGQLSPDPAPPTPQSGQM